MGGLLSTLLAIGIAGLALQAARLLAPGRPRWPLDHPLPQRVRAAHSGHAGDTSPGYWPGIVALTAAVGLPLAEQLPSPVPVLSLQHAAYRRSLAALLPA